MKKCKLCQKEFEGTSLFCSTKCQAKYASNFVKVHKCNFHRKKALYGTWECKVCKKVFETRKLLYEHNKLHRVNSNINEPWNKGLTKETDIRLKKAAEKLSKKLKERIIIPSFLGKHCTEEQKLKISESMKKAHAEGRAHNIGTCRWNNKPSYPEEFFMKVIENEFIDKNYIREMSFIKYSLDFAWPHKKKVIEIDGEQHERFEEYKLRDQQKDQLLKENDWQVLRIKWKDMMSDTKLWIKISKNFIDN